MAAPQSPAVGVVAQAGGVPSEGWVRYQIQLVVVSSWAAAPVSVAKMSPKAMAAEAVGQVGGWVAAVMAAMAAEHTAGAYRIPA